MIPGKGAWGTKGAVITNTDGTYSPNRYAKYSPEDPTLTD